MERFYLDNFRGFSEQYIEIKNVNFLVGENSSGKSSLLLVLNTISYPGFWFNLDFHSGDAQVYSFEDLVSVEAENKSSFRIGCFHEDEKDFSFLFEFKSLNGKPIISSGIIEQDKNLFLFYCKKEQVKYKIFKNKMISPEMIKSLPEETGKLDTLPVQMKTSFIPPVILLQMCEYAIDKKRNGHQGKLPIWPITPIAPIRSKPKKTYDEPGTAENPEGDHIPYEIRRLHKANPDIIKNINNFGVYSGMYKKIDIKEYGSDDDAPFRMNFILNKKPINIVNIGYGVSQILPILFTMYWQDSSIVTIQQPEVHLHPKAQAALGDIFFDLSIGKKRKRLIIETHSDYIIDRFRQKQKKSSDKVSVHTLFFIREKAKIRFSQFILMTMAIMTPISLTNSESFLSKKN
jgi:predicted ATPase